MMLFSKFLRPNIAGVVVRLLACGTFVASTPSGLSAQLSSEAENAPLQVSDEVRQTHMVHVAPHLLVFTPSSKTATVELSNTGKSTTTASVVVQYGYTAWPNADTALYTKRLKDSRARDTVVDTPGPNDRSAVRWISGYPTSVTLAPQEKKRVTLRIDPPKDLPAGEYSARLVTIVAPPSPKPSDTKTKDARTVYKLPVTGTGIQTLRDSVRIYYRTGQVTMGLRLINGKAALDPDRARVAQGRHEDDVWTMFTFEVTGNADVQGAMQARYTTADGGEIPLTVQPGNVMTLHGKGTMRWYAQAASLQPGKYNIVVTFTPFQEEFPENQRLPMVPVELAIPFEVR